MAERSYHYLLKGKIKKYNFDEEQDSTQRKTLLNVHSFCGGKCSVFIYINFPVLRLVSSLLYNLSWKIFYPMSLMERYVCSKQKLWQQALSYSNSSGHVC